MWPWGHAAVGYLAYRAWVARTGRPLDGLAVVALGVGTQAPDLVDKPLGWYTAVLPAGRSLAHSVLVALLVTAVAYSAARRYGSAVPGAFALGYWTHLAADSYKAFVLGDLSGVAYLAYPFVALPPEPEGVGVLYLLRRLELTPFLAVELLVTVAAVALWLRDGHPGLGTLRSWLARLRSPSDAR